VTIHETLRIWLLEAADETIELAACDEIEQGARELRDAIEVAAAVPYQSQVLPVLRNLDKVDGSARAEQFVEFASDLRWVQSHRWDDGGEQRALCVLSEAFELPGARGRHHVCRSRVRLPPPQPSTSRALPRRLGLCSLAIRRI